MCSGWFSAHCIVTNPKVSGNHNDNSLLASRKTGTEPDALQRRNRPGTEYRRLQGERSRNRTYVTTAEYDPRNSKNGLPNLEEAKAFVEVSRPWDLYGAQGAEVEPEVRPASTTPEPTDEPAAAAPPPQPVAGTPEPTPQASPPLPNKRWWEFWK